MIQRFNTQTQFVWSCLSGLLYIKVAFIRYVLPTYRIGILKGV